MALLNPFRRRGVHTSPGEGSAPEGSFVSSTGGNDSTGLGTFTSPWQTINEALLHQSSWVNNTLYIMGEGTVYSTYFGIGKITDGTVGSPKCIRGLSTTTRPIIRPSTTDAGEAIVYLDNVAHVEFYDLEIDGANVQPDRGIYINGAGSSHLVFEHVFVHDIRGAGSTTPSQFTCAGILVGAGVPGGRITFRRCEISSNGRASGHDHGLYMSGAQNSVIEDCDIHHNAAYGIHGYNSAGLSSVNDNVIVRRNYVHDNGAEGIQMAGGTDIQIINNLIVNNARRGIQQRFTAPTSSCLIAHNTIYQWGNEGIDISADNSNVKIYNNLVWDGSGGSTAAIINDSTSSTVVGNSFSTANPQFLDASTNWRLSSASTSINLGTDIGVATDFDGNPRVGNPDAGCFEFQG